jgi:hypothetical protein
LRAAEAERYLEEAESSYLPDQFLSLALAWAQAGRLDRAYKVSKGIGSNTEIAVAYARAGKLDEALQRMAAIDYDVERSQVLEAIAITYSREGDLKRAVETAARQTNDSSKLQTYAGILAAWKARNDKRWADFDADARFKDAWTELWWRSAAHLNNHIGADLPVRLRASFLPSSGERASPCAIAVCTTKKPRGIR